MKFTFFKRSDGISELLPICESCNGKGTRTPKDEHCVQCHGRGHWLPVEILRHVVNWLDHSKEDANYEISSLDGAFRVWRVAMVSGWDVWLDDLPADAVKAAEENRHEDALKIVNAWMNHAEYHNRSKAEKSCVHCVRKGWIQEVGRW